MLVAPVLRTETTDATVSVKVAGFTGAPGLCTLGGQSDGADGAAVGTGVGDSAGTGVWDCAGTGVASGAVVA